MVVNILVFKLMECFTDAERRDGYENQGCDDEEPNDCGK
jgi:hypothetical protein